MNQMWSADESAATSTCNRIQFGPTKDQIWLKVADGNFLFAPLACLIHRPLKMNASTHSTPAVIVDALRKPLLFEKCIEQPTRKRASPFGSAIAFIAQEIRSVEHQRWPLRRCSSASSPIGG